MNRSIAVAFLLLAVGAPAAPQGKQDKQAPKTPKEAAPIDLTGNWVSVVTEDWRWRMLIPKKSDYTSVPLNAEGKKLADTWEPAKLSTDGCKAFGAAAIMREPGRLYITWENDTTLRIDTDAGKQTRLLRFDKSKPPADRTWQGNSAAEWERIPAPGGAGVSLAQRPGLTGALTVVTTNLKAGYLRKNGAPYSEDTMVTEHFDRLTDKGVDWMTVFTIVEDARYLDQPFITSTHFKREPDRSKWMPKPCE